MDPKIFITYSSKDKKVSETICHALEHRGLICWISSRNVKPGQNYQEQIVKAIRAAKIMVLVFTANANNSNEIKKELAVASQNNLVVIPVRVEDVTPNEAFVYEFATRQWIDLFDDWEKSIARLVNHIESVIEDEPSGDLGKAASGFAGDAVISPSGKIAKPAAFMRWPGLRWALVSGFSIIAAAAIAYEVALPSKQATAPSQPPVQTVAPAPSQLAPPPQQALKPPAVKPPPAQTAAKPQVPQSVESQCIGNSDMPFNVMIAACESWLRIDPNSAEAYAWIGSHFGDSKNYDQAIAYLNRAIALKPNFAFAYSIRGGIYTQKGLASMDPKLRNTDSGFKNQAINQAIADYRTVLRVDPGGNYASGAQFQLKLLGASP